MSRVIASGLVLQVFTDFGKSLGDEELAVYKTLAESVREDTLTECTTDMVSRTNVDTMFSIVQNSYQFDIDIPSMSGWELRNAVSRVAAMSSCMHRFANNPAGELHRFSPEAAAERAEANFQRECRIGERIATMLGID